MSTAMEDGPKSSLTVWMGSNGDQVGAIHLTKTGEDQILTYVEAVDHLIKSYTADANIAKTSSKKANLQKVAAEMSVRFADVWRGRVAHCRKCVNRKTVERDISWWTTVYKHCFLAVRKFQIQNRCIIIRISKKIIGIEKSELIKYIIKANEKFK